MMKTFTEGVLQNWGEHDPAALVCQDPQVPADRRHGREGACHVQHHLPQAQDLHQGEFETW